MSRYNLFYQIVVDIVATAIGDKTRRSKYARLLVTVLSFAVAGGLLYFVLPALKDGTLTVKKVLWIVGILAAVGAVIWILVVLLRRDTIREKVCKGLVVLGKIIFWLATFALIVGIMWFFGALAKGTESLGGKIFWMVIPVVALGWLIVCVVRALSED